MSRTFSNYFKGDARRRLVSSLAEGDQRHGSSEAAASQMVRWISPKHAGSDKNATITVQRGKAKRLVGNELDSAVKIDNIPGLLAKRIAFGDLHIFLK